MNKLFDFIEQHKIAIIGTLLLHVGIFVYLQIETYSQNIYYTPENHVFTKIEPDDEVIELNPENIESPQDASAGGPITNLTKNENDTRKSSATNFSKSSIDKQVEEDLKNFESSTFSEYSKNNPPPKKENTYNDEPKNTTKTNTPKEQVSGDGISTQIKGQTMVSYNMTGRYPHNNNDWYIRNPGYTCGENSNGIVVVDITVDAAGNVTSSRVNSTKSSGATTCMLEKAQDYASKSRFAYKSGAPASQSGTITYRFVAK